MMKKYSHVLWDWNGTLMDDAALCVDVFNLIGAKRGLPRMTLERYREIFGFPVKDYYEAAGFDFGRESFEAVGREWMDEYERRKYGCALREGAAEALRRVAALGAGQAVLSAYSSELLKDTVGHYGLAGYFQRLCGLDTIYAPSKVELGRRLVAELGASRGGVLMVGDTAHDLETAEAIGADCVLIAGGHQSRARLERTGTRVLSSAAELFSI